MYGVSCPHCPFYIEPEFNLTDAALFAAAHDIATNHVSELIESETKGVSYGLSIN